MDLTSDDVQRVKNFIALVEKVGVNVFPGETVVQEDVRDMYFIEGWVFLPELLGLLDALDDE